MPGYVKPHIQVLRHYEFPFSLRQDQKDDIDSLAPYPRTGNWVDVGLGKSVVSTSVALYQALEGLIDQVLIVVPPILADQWFRWLNEVKPLDKDQELTVEIYRGTPAKRKKIPLTADFAITTIGLIKNDYERIMKELGPKRLSIIVDEATMIRTVSTGNFKAVRDLVETKPAKRLQLLSATPLGASPIGAYGYIRLKTPTIYSSIRQFYLNHVTSVDQYGTPNKFINLDSLHSNLMLFSVSRRASDILDLPEVNYIPFDYSLDARHQKLYDRLVDELLLEFTDGQVIDGTNQQRLYQATQQLIINVPDEKIRPAAFDVIDQVLEETGILRGSGEKLMIYSHFRRSNEAVVAYLESKGIGVVRVYGGQDNEKALQKFEHDSSVSVMSANIKAGGCGLNLQFARYQLFLELPRVSADFVQAVGRVKRSGQKRNITIWIATALNTVQQSLRKNVLSKETVVQAVAPTAITLRDALKGK